MIHELACPIESHLVADCPFPEAWAILSGTNPGWVFADDLSTPRSLLVWAQGVEGFYLIGDSDNVAFLEDIDRCIDPALS